MLTQLSLANFAVVAAAQLQFGEGMTVISGETGAGKSLLVDAMLLLTGARADSGVVRHGAERAEIQAEFSLEDAPAAAAWLAENELDEGMQLQLRRVINADGGSKSWINGRACTLSQLSSLAALLVEIHGQHDQQSLLARPSQLTLLDAYGRHDQLLLDVADAAHAWTAAIQRKQKLLEQGDVTDRIQWLQHQHAELERENLDPAFWEQLQVDHKRLGNVGNLQTAFSSYLTQLQGDDDSRGLLGGVQSLQSEITRHADGDPVLEGVAELLAQSEISLAEAASQLENVLDQLDMDPDAFDAADRVLTRMHELGRKHRVEVAELGTKRDSIVEELQSLQGAEQELAQLDGKLAALRDEYASKAANLTKSRAKAAKALSKVTTELMQELGMEGGTFEVALEKLDALKPDALGMERVELMVAANQGQPARPLRKVASGGELSRISLAIEVATIGLDPVPTMVFDEVDSGIGGAVADIVGFRLRKLATQRQVLCVTHLPQVASKGHAHYQVSKFAAEGLTQSAVKQLPSKERQTEIARMLAGVDVTKEAQAAAKSLLAAAMSQD